MEIRRNRVLLILPILCLALWGLDSCDQKNSSKKVENKISNNVSKVSPKKRSVDIIWNETIQNSFYGAEFGDDLAKVSLSFRENGYVPDASRSSHNVLVYDDGRYSFGNLDWAEIIVYFHNDRFWQIVLYSRKFSPFTHDYLEEFYNILLNGMKQRYGLTKISNEQYEVYSNDGRFVEIKKHVVGESDRIRLRYIDKKYRKGASSDF